MSSTRTFPDHAKIKLRCSECRAVLYGAKVYTGGRWICGDCLYLMERQQGGHPQPSPG